MSKYQRLGDEARDRGDFAGAEAYYRKHLTEHANHAAIWVQLGHALKEQYGHGRAVDAYEKAVECDPDDPDALLHLGHALKVVGRIEDAIEAFQAALRKNPTAELVRELAALGEAPDMIVPEAAHDRIFLAIQDLFGYLRAHPTMSGIQRVQAGIAEYVIAAGRDDVSFIISGATEELGPGQYYEIDRQHLQKILSYATGRRVDHDRLRRLISESEKHARVVELNEQDTLVILGAFWGYMNTVDRFLESKRGGARIGCYIYDLIPITHPEYCDAALAREFALALAEAVQVADFFLTISEFTAKTLRAFLKQHGHSDVPVSAVPLAHMLTGKSSTSPAWPKGLDRLGDRDFALYVSTIEGRKNHIYVLHVWRRLIELGVDVPDLVFVGRMGWRTDGLREILSGNKDLSRRVHIVHDLTDREITSLYGRCLFTVFTSFVEGWGLPVGESLVNHKPCIASSTSSIPEVGGDYVDYIDPYNVSGGIEVFRRMIEDVGYRESRRKNIAERFQFRSWRQVGEDFFSKIGATDGETRPFVGTPLPAGEVVWLSVPEIDRRADYVDYPLRLVFSEGFYPAEDFGLWMKGREAAIEFKTPYEEGAELRLFLAVTSIYNEPVECVVSASGVDTGQSRLRYKGNAVLRLRGKVQSHGLARVLLSVQSPLLRPANDSRDLSIGLRGIAYCLEAEFSARMSILEELSLGLGVERIVG